MAVSSVGYKAAFFIRKNEEQKIKTKKNGAARNRTGAGAATTRRHTTRPQHLLDIKLGPFLYYNHI